MQEGKLVFIQVRPGLTVTALLDVVDSAEIEGAFEIVLRVPLSNKNDADTIAKMIEFEILKVKGR